MRSPILPLFSALGVALRESVPQVKLYSDPPQFDDEEDAARRMSQVEFWPIAVIGQVVSEEAEMKTRSDALVSFTVSVWTREESRKGCLEFAEAIRRRLIDGPQIDGSPDEFSFSSFRLDRLDSNPAIFDGSAHYQEAAMTLLVRARDLRVVNQKL